MFLIRLIFGIATLAAMAVLISAFFAAGALGWLIVLTSLARG